MGKSSKKQNQNGKHQKYKQKKTFSEPQKKISKAEKIKERKKGVKIVSEIKRKDPGLPNLRQVARGMEEQKQKVAKESIQSILEKKKANEKLRLSSIPQSQQLAALAASAANRLATFDMQVESSDMNVATKRGDVENTRRAFYRELHKILETADVILEVLDARDPLGCRPMEIERYIHQKDPNKRIVLVLNKIDLVPKEVVTSWLKYLRREHPTVAIKCSTQSQKHNLGRSGKIAGTDASRDQLLNSECIGGEQLLQLLKNYSRSKDMKVSVTVGVIGYPNVGKSSLINSLVRTRAVETGAQAGITKVAQEVHLDKKVKLLDCPGIIFAKDETDVATILRNCVKINAVVDPMPAVQEILRRCDRTKLMHVYRIGRFGSDGEFLQLVAQVREKIKKGGVLDLDAAAQGVQEQCWQGHLLHKHMIDSSEQRIGQNIQVRGKIKKGGVLDLDAAARGVLQDWNSGRIAYFTPTPAVPESLMDEAAVIVSGWGKEFDIDSIQQVAVLDAACAGLDEAFISMQGLSLAGVASDMRFTEVGGDNGHAGDDAMDAEHASAAGPAGRPAGGANEPFSPGSGQFTKATKRARMEAAAAAVRLRYDSGLDSSPGGGGGGGGGGDSAGGISGDQGGRFGALQALHDAGAAEEAAMAAGAGAVGTPAAAAGTAGAMMDE